MSVGLGTETPQFDLPGVDGQNHSLGSYGDAEALVLVQSCNHCPYVQAWEGRLSAIARDYAARGSAGTRRGANAGSVPVRPRPEARLPRGDRRLARRGRGEPAVLARRPR